MSEREKQHRFLKELIRSHDSDQCRELRDRISKAERDERCIRSAVFLVVVIALLAGAGLAYSAVLVPEFFQSTSPFVVRLFSVIVLGCVICLLGFGAFWWWYRGICNRLYHECRNWIMSHKAATPPPDNVQKQGVDLLSIVTPATKHDTQIVPHPSF